MFTLKRRLERINTMVERKNKSSQNLIKLVGEQSEEGLREAGKISGRLEFIKILFEDCNYDYVTGTERLKQEKPAI